MSTTELVLANENALIEIRNEKAKEFIAAAAYHKAAFYEALYALEELTGKEVSPNSPVIHNLSDTVEEHGLCNGSRNASPIVSADVLGDFLAELKDAPSAFECADGSCHLNHNDRTENI